MRENVQKLCPELWLQKNWLLYHNNALSHTSYFTREFLTKNNITVVLHPPYFSPFSQLQKKVKGHRFDTSEMIEAESQAVLNTLT
jgi:hypothetical protein